MKRRMKMRSILFIALLLAGCGGKEEKEEAVRPVFYQEVGKTTIHNTRTFPGVTQPGHEAKLSFKVGGLIEQLNVEMGDTVKRGRTIAWLDSSDFRINYNKALSSLKNAEAQLATAKSTYLRIEDLYVNNHASLSDYEKAKVQFESAEAMVKTAQSQVNAAQNQLNYTVLKAPFNGVVSDVLARENEMTGAGNPIVVFSSTNNLEVKTAAPENIIGQIKRGQEVAVRFSALPGKTLPGRITEISPGTPSASAYPVIVQLTEYSSQLFPGMTGTVEIPLYGNGNDSEDIIIIVSDAVGHDQTGDYVFVAGKSDEKDIYVAEKRNVTLGELRPEGYRVLEGLNKGDIVITAGLSFLYEGRRVRLLDENE